MTARWRLWWTGRTLREQRLLLVMFALIAVVVVWLLILRPLDDARSRARARLDAAAAQAGLIAARADELRLARRAGFRPLGSPLAVIAGDLATQTGLTLTRNDLDGAGRLVVSIPSARAPALYGWLARLDAAGVVTDRVRLTPNSDATLAVEATLRARRP